VVDLYTHNCVVDVPQPLGLWLSLLPAVALSWLGDKLMTTTDRTFRVVEFVPDQLTKALSGFPSVKLTYQACAWDLLFYKTGPAVMFDFSRFVEP